MEQIRNVTGEKDIGIPVDYKFKFGTHITSKINTANRNLAIIRRSFTYKDKTIFLHLHKSLVRPHLEYASPVLFSFLKKYQVAPLENVQRRATKLLPSIKN